MPVTAIRNFLNLESASGMILIAVAVLAMLIANSSVAGVCEDLLDTYASVSVGSFEISKPLLLWINNGLMAIFFLLIGLEVKREMLEASFPTAWMASRSVPSPDLCRWASRRVW